MRRHGEHVKLPNLAAAAFTAATLLAAAARLEASPS